MAGALPRRAGKRACPALRPEGRRPALAQLGRDRPGTRRVARPRRWRGSGSAVGPELAGRAGPAQGLDPGPLRARRPPPGAAELGGCPPRGGDLRGRRQLGAAARRLRPRAGHGPVRPSGAGPHPRGRRPGRAAAPEPGARCPTSPRREPGEARSSAISRSPTWPPPRGSYGTLVQRPRLHRAAVGRGRRVCGPAESTWPADAWRSSRPPPRSAARSSSAPRRPTSAARCPSRGSSPSRSPPLVAGKASRRSRLHLSGRACPAQHQLPPPGLRPGRRQAGLPGLTPHELRHTAASLAVAAGANIKAVQQMLGHASAAMTLDVYAGLFADDLDAVAERLDQAVMRRGPAANADYLRTDGPETPARPLSRDRERGRDLRLMREPPIGVEPMTYALRVRRSSRLS